MEQNIFSPHFGSNQAMTVSATSVSLGVSITDTVLCIQNTDATNTVFVRIGETSATATSADMPILAKDKHFLRKPYHFDKIALICPAGTAVTYITAGNGGY